MTDRMLKDLLEERVADLTMADLSAAAWRDGRRAQRRGRLAVLGAVAVLAAGVSGGIAILDDDTSATGPAPAPGVPTETASATSRQPDATYEDVPVWWSPRQQDESVLPRVASPLPGVIDLDEGALVETMPSAVAAFARNDDHVVLVRPDGGLFHLPIQDLDDVVKPNGYGYRPVHTSMLSPTGEYLVFPQDDSVRLYAIATGEWSIVDTGDARTLDVTWYDDTTLLLPRNGAGSPGPMWDVEGRPMGDGERPRASPGFDTLTAQAYGQTFVSGTSAAQAWGMGVPVPVRDPGTDLSDPDFIVATVDGQTSLLAMTWNARGDGRGDGRGGRFKDCCPVAGWLSDDVVVYESKQTEPALVAWTVATDEFRLVSRIEGDYFLASFADLS
jgi:hypothetical protein